MLRPNNQSGSVALEALLSIMIMFVAIYALWAVSVYIYNQSQVTTATQFASHTAVNSMVIVDPYLGDDNHKEASQTDPSNADPNNPNNSRRSFTKSAYPETFCLHKSMYYRAVCISRAQADFVFDDNALALLPDQFTGKFPTTAGSNSPRLQIACNTSKTPFDDPADSGKWQEAYCQGDGVTAVRTAFVAPEVLSSFSFLNFAGPSRESRPVSYLSGSTATRYLFNRRVP